jgi:hypothetical protein
MNDKVRAKIERNNERLRELTKKAKEKKLVED